jgi:hypothetical protein
VQSQILTAHPQVRLRVYAIWVNKQVGDARSRWDAAGLIDPRVVHLWDAKDASGAWLAGNVQGYQGSDWDTYLLVGPEAPGPASRRPCAAPARRCSTGSRSSAKPSPRSLPHPGKHHDATASARRSTCSTLGPVRATAG